MYRGHSFFFKNFSKRYFFVKRNDTLFNKNCVEVLELLEKKENSLPSICQNFSFLKGRPSTWRSSIETHNDTLIFKIGQMISQA